MPCTQLACESLKELKELIEVERQKSADNNIFVLFTGKIDPATGSSWCPDCVKADPIVEECVKNDIKDEDVFIVCVVGDRPKWKDPKCEFRTDSATQLKGIPTLLKWGTQDRLGDNECADANLVKMLFEDD